MDDLIVARHGESAYSAVGRVNGDPSVAVDLTDRGREEARRLGELLTRDPIGLFVTYVMRAARGDGLPLTLEGTQAGHAEPHRLGRDEAERAAARLDAYVRDPAEHAAPG